ncbi:glycine-rich cell wall structural protein 1.0-like isoform X2 [Cyprinus carpio]|uniref:Glycine-rich cell wall structural protein 1.0-like isoform X2 n=1 Tax=Cyprinus carpio TaxID=7962 RepID=A0A9R0A0V7_CYPCA|nr:glycine-rich cell wall structural protein 1.0-like isoform X2 [Cyprinus carpio]
MLVRVILQTSLVLWLVQNTIQGGVRPQTGALGRLASRGPGISVKSGVAGILGARGYGAGKPAGRYLGGAAYRPTSIRGGLTQGYGTLGYGGAANLGTGLGAAGLRLGTRYGLGNGLGAALGYPAGKLGGRGYTSNGYGAQLGYGAGGYPGAGRGYGLGAAGFLGAGFTNGYGAGLGAGGYPQGVRAGKQIGYSNGYGSEVYGTADGYGAGPAYPSVLADNVGLNGIAGHGAGGLGGPGLVVNPGLDIDAKTRKYGAGGVLGAAGSLPYGGQPVVSAGLGPQGKTGSYGGTTYGGIPTLGPDTALGGTGGAMEPLAGGAVGQIPYSAPVIAAGLEVDADYSFGAEELSLGADATKTATKYGTGYAAALSTAGQGPYGGQKDGGKLSGIYGNGYKG